MPSWQARVAATYAHALIRRSDWGVGPAVAQRARRVFGLPAAYGWMVSRGLHVERVDTTQGVRGEWVSRPVPPRGVILYIHGGAYLACSAATHRPIIAALARATRCRVFGVDYRLSPETPFPGAYDDVVAAYRWLCEYGAPNEPIVVAGDSAGGGLALALAAHVREAGLPSPACVVALSPVTDLSATGESVVRNDGRCAMFRPQNMHAFAALYLAGAPADDPRASPLYANVDGLPPVLMQVSTTELLLDDARRMQARITSAGGSCRLTEYDDLVHAWQLLSAIVPEAAAAITEISAFIETELTPALEVAR